MKPLNAWSRKLDADIFSQNQVLDEILAQNAKAKAPANSSKQNTPATAK